MTYRSNHLSEFVKNRCIKALRAAIDDDGPIEVSIAGRIIDDVLRSHAFRERVKLASASESNELAMDIKEFVRELTEVGLKGVGLAPPSAVMPREPDKTGDRPSIFNGVRLAEAAREFREADEALQKSAGDAVPPLQSVLADWVGHCPHYVLTEAEKRLAVMWGLEPKQVRVTGWAFGGLVMWKDGIEFHVPAAELVDTAQRWEIPNPLVPLVRACPTPVDGEANLRPVRILSAKLAMVDPSHRRAGRLFSLPRTGAASWYYRASSMSTKALPCPWLCTSWARTTYSVAAGLPLRWPFGCSSRRSWPRRTRNGTRASP